jgi:hypothetical protein
MRKEERMKVGVVNDEVPANTKGSQRKGSLMIAGDVFSVTQSKKKQINSITSAGMAGLAVEAGRRDEGHPENTGRNGKGRSAPIRLNRSWPGGPLGPVLPLWFS